MKYSITIPAYKAVFLSKCIDSVLAQTCQDFELIIVNDASPEDLDIIINSYNDERIRYYRNEKNCGAIDVVDNWNKCLSYASGDYVICMGDDDELSPDCLEQYNLLMDEYPNLDIYHGRVKIIDENSMFYSLQEARPSFESIYSMMWHRMSGRIQFIGDFLYKRQTLILNGGFFKLPLAWASDDISAYIAAADNGIANTQKPIFFYRVNSLSISLIGNTKIKLCAINMENQWYKDFIKSSPGTNDVDICYINMIKRRLEIHFKKKKINTIAQDLSSKNFFRLFYWFRIGNSVSVSFSEVLFAFIISLKKRIQLVKS